MTAQADALYNYLTGSNIINSLVYQEGEFREGSESGYIVLIPNAGSNARPWMREQNYRVYLFGQKSDPLYGGNQYIGEIANELVKYINNDASPDGLAYIESGEAMVLKRTESDRPVIQLNLMAQF